MFREGGNKSCDANMYQVRKAHIQGRKFLEICGCYGKLLEWVGVDGTGPEETMRLQRRPSPRSEVWSTSDVKKG